MRDTELSVGCKRSALGIAVATLVLWGCASDLARTDTYIESERAPYHDSNRITTQTDRAADSPYETSSCDGIAEEGTINMGSDRLCILDEVCLHGYRVYNHVTGDYCLMDTTGTITYKGDVLKRGPARGNVFELLNQDRPRPECGGRFVGASSGHLVLTSGQCFHKGYNITYSIPSGHCVTIQSEYAGLAVFHVTPCSRASPRTCLYDLGAGARLHYKDRCRP